MAGRSIDRTFSSVPKTATEPPAAFTCNMPWSESTVISTSWPDKGISEFEHPHTQARDNANKAVFFIFESIIH